jgi:hypothetical protein
MKGRGMAEKRKASAAARAAMLAKLGQRDEAAMLKDGAEYLCIVPAALVELVKRGLHPLKINVRQAGALCGDPMDGDDVANPYSGFTNVFMKALANRELPHRPEPEGRADLWTGVRTPESDALHFGRITAPDLAAWFESKSITRDDLPGELIWRWIDGRQRTRDTGERRAAILKRAAELQAAGV